MFTEIIGHVKFDKNDEPWFVEDNTFKQEPLTPKILERNGWKRYKDTNTFFNNDMPHCASIDYHDGVFKYKHGECIVRDNIRFVHELQNLLCGLGLNYTLWR